MSKLWAAVLVLLFALSLPFGLVSPALGAVAFDAATASSNSDASSSTISYTHTPVGTPTAVVVTVISTGAKVSSLTYGWTNMTFLQSASPGSSVRVEQWGLANPFPGAQTVRATVTGGPDALSSTAVTFTGSGTTFRTAFRAKDTNTDPSSSAITVTVSGVVTGSMTVDCAATDGGAALSAPNRTQRLNFNNSYAGFKIGVQTAVATGSVVMSWTGDQRAWGTVATEVLASSGGAANALHSNAHRGGWAGPNSLDTAMVLRYSH